MMDRNPTLDQARQAIQNGDREAGRRLLASLLRADPRNAAAWLLLSQVVDSEQQRADCLRRAAALDPGNRLGAERAEPGTMPPADLARSSDFSRSAQAADPAHSSDFSRFASPPAAWTAEGAGILEQPAELPVVSSPQSGYLADERLRRRGYRYVMLAGALLFTLLLGLVLLVLIVSTVVPQAQDKMRPTLEPVLYAATLWCPPCAQAGTPIILWEKAGGGASRGDKVGELPHGTAVSVLAQTWSEAEGRTYYRVSADGQQGWVPDSFVK